MKSTLTVAALVYLPFAGGAAASPAEAFDLLCNGQTTQHSEAKPFADRISVDLESMRWCDRQAGCPFVIKIRGRQGEKLTLLAAKTPYNEAQFDVDLKSQAFVKVTRIPDRPDSEISAKGVCTVAPFTPLP